MPAIPGLDADVYFGAPGRPLPDWRAVRAGESDDDEPTPDEWKAVVAMLGFDPRDEAGDTPGGGAAGGKTGCGCASCRSKATAGKPTPLARLRARLRRAAPPGERLAYAASTALVRNASGQHVSAKSRTGDPACSAAVSAWKTGHGTPEVHKTLAHCRALARGKAQAHLQRAAGHELRAQRLEHLMRSGAPVTARERRTKARTLKETLVSRRAARAEKAARPRGTTLNLSRGVSVRESDTPGVHVTTEAHSGWSHGWVAAMVPSHTEHGPAHGREFLRPHSTDLSRAGNGSKHYRDLPEGTYEADSVHRSFQPHRAFFHVQGGKVEHLSEDEAVARVHGMGVSQLQEARINARKALDEKRAAESKAAAESAKSSGLPELKGSEKQVQWANQIRAAKLAELATNVASGFERLEAHPTWDAEKKAEQRKHVQDAVARVHAQSSAGWWIDRRTSPAMSIMRELAAQPGATRTPYARNDAKVCGQ